MGSAPSTNTPTVLVCIIQKGFYLFRTDLSIKFNTGFYFLLDMWFFLGGGDIMKMCLICASPDYNLKLYRVATLTNCIWWSYTSAIGYSVLTFTTSGTVLLKILYTKQTL